MSAKIQYYLWHESSTLNPLIDIYDSERLWQVRYGVVANIIASHAIARGSIPRVGNKFCQIT